MTASGLALEARGLRRLFPRAGGGTTAALAGIDLTLQYGTLTALVGPDGAGKTTFLRLAAGLLMPDAGTLRVLGLDVTKAAQAIQDRIGYMPQRFGLYEDLSVQENLDLYAELHGVPRSERRPRYARLLEMTALGPFTGRLAGRLSGGMKQKLGLACTLVRRPDLLLLDEPTVGVDPLSRRELWAIIHQLVADGELTVLLSTSYLDEAERCAQAVVLREGRILAAGPPEEVRALAAGRTWLIAPPADVPARQVQAALLDDPQVIDAVPEGGRVRVVYQSVEAANGRPAGAVPVPARFEDGFMVVLRQAGGVRARPSQPAPDAGSHAAPPPGAGETPAVHTAPASDAEPVVVTSDLVRRFGEFTAVDHVSFQVGRGEVFGLLGPNGAGKTTTFRMLCGLLAASSGTLRVAGADLRHARASARRRLGYVAQKFSLYGQLTVLENLAFFASAYGLHGRRKRQRLAWALDEFELGAFVRVPAEQVPGGFRQRLAMAAALLHEPETLFLDEPTSGADPLARREFWRRITDLAARGITIIVTTHFMEEAEYCDHVAILDAGRILARGTPADIRRHATAAGGAAPTMEEAFIAIVQESRRQEAA
jgi:ABC-2 type transport system ATP-binding protein